MTLRDSWGRLHPKPTISAEATAIATVISAHRRAHRSRIRTQLQLRSVLRRAHPAAASAWSHLDGGLSRPEARAVLAAAPTGAAANRLTPYRLSKILLNAGRTRLVDAEADRLRQLFTTPQHRPSPPVEQALAVDVRASLARVS